MASPSITNTFTNGTAADATQVNQNFTDLVNALSDSSKDIDVSTLSTAGAIDATGAISTASSVSAKKLIVTPKTALTLSVASNTVSPGTVGFYEITNLSGGAATIDVDGGTAEVGSIVYFAYMGSNPINQTLAYTCDGEAVAASLEKKVVAFLRTAGGWFHI